MANSSKVAPGPKSWPVIGHIPELQNDVLKLMRDNFAQFGDLVRFKLGPLTIHLLSSPTEIGRVLKDLNNFDKQTRTSSMISRLTGDSLLVSNGEKWRSQRVEIQKAFAIQELKSFVPLFSECVDEFVLKLKPLADSGQTIDIASEMMGLTYRIVERSLFSGGDEKQLAELESAISIVLNDVYSRIENPFSIPAIIPTTHNRKYKQAMGLLDERVFHLIESHKDQPGNDLLHRMIRSQLESGPLDPIALRNQAITLLIAGHETTAVGLAWFFYLLAQHPNVEERLCEEIEQTQEEFHGRPGELDGLEYTSKTIAESFRLYPPIWAIIRRVVTDQVVCGYTLKAGSRLVISPYVVHRHPEFWDDPEDFNPDRGRPKHPLANLAFGGGPRLCVGHGFAKLESQVIIAKLLKQFRFTLVENQEIKPVAGITLRPENGIKMRVESRN